MVLEYINEGKYYEQEIYYDDFDTSLIETIVYIVLQSLIKISK